MTDKVTGFSVAGELAFDTGVVQVAAVRRRQHDRKKERNTVENDTNGGSCQYCNLYDTTFESLGADVVRHVSLPNFMRNGGGQLPAAASFHSTSMHYLNALRALDGQPILDENGDPTGDRLRCVAHGGAIQSRCSRTT